MLDQFTEHCFIRPQFFDLLDYVTRRSEKLRFPKKKKKKKKKEKKEEKKEGFGDPAMKNRSMRT